MGELSLNLEWCASWCHDNRHYCTLFIKESYFNKEKFNDMLNTQFGNDYGSWKIENHMRGIEIWFYKKQDMLTFKLLTQTVLKGEI
tara:strand:+ start:1079 stop:1336 length:258 start_codon:yes stop_codon:yes gene_type:complete